MKMKLSYKLSKSVQSTTLNASSETIIKRDEPLLDHSPSLLLTDEDNEDD